MLILKSVGGANPQELRTSQSPSTFLFNLIKGKIVIKTKKEKIRGQLFFMLFRFMHLARYHENTPLSIRGVSLRMHDIYRGGTFQP